MNTPLIVTKLVVPPGRTGLIKRPRLLARLDEGLQRGHRLTLLSASAGSGKTTLVSEWLQPPGRHALRVAWLSLDPADDQPVRFCLYLLAALERAVSGIGQGLPEALQSPQPPPPELVIAHLINQLAGIEAPLVLVLDDYHTIQDRAIHAGLALLLERQPTSLHLALLTRRDPPLPLNRLRARELLTELRTADLRFTPEEVADFLHQAIHLDLTPEMVAAIEQRTEGWIAGLQLAAVSLQGHPAPASFLLDFTSRQHYILEYLSEEVLERQPAPVQDFLLRTSILERLNAGLCAWVLQEDLPQPVDKPPPDYAATLEALAHANLFISTLDPGHTWYRYHALFAEILRQRLHQRLPLEQVRRLHQRAGEWYARQGAWEEAMSHLLEAQAYDHMADLIEQSFFPIILQVRLAAILAWLQALPIRLVQGRPWLSLVQCWVLVYTGRLRQARPWLEAAEQLLSQAQAPESDRILSTPGGTPDLPGHAALLRAFLCERAGDLPKATHYAQNAIQRLASDPEPSLALAYYILGQAQRLSGELSRAQRAFETMVATGMNPAAPLTTTTISGLCELATLARWQGRLEQAEAYYLQAAALAAPGRPASFEDSPGIELAALYDVGLASLLYERDQLVEARRRLVRVIEAVRQSEWWGAPAEYALAYPYLARTLLALDDLPAAESVLSEGQQLQWTLDLCPEYHYLLEDVQVTVWIRRGEIQRAETWMTQQASEESSHPVDEWFHSLATTPAGQPFYISYNASPVGRSAWVQERRGLARARLALVFGQPEQALQFLAPLAQAARSGRWTGGLIEIGVWQAVAWYQASPEDPQPALDALVECLRLAQPQGYRRTFLDAGPVVGELLARLAADEAWRAAQPALAGYVDALQTPIQTPGSPANVARLTVPPGPVEAERASHRKFHATDNLALVEPLTGRELEVLRRLCAGQSNAEIAAGLVISLNTVKKHISHLFAKLGVTSRVQAMLRAAELGLLREE